MPHQAEVWKISGKWLRRPHECTLAGIHLRCHGGCCTHPGYWPPNAYGGVCGNLGPAGCTWAQETRPISCLLYPLRLNKQKKLVVHYAVTGAHSVCRGNHGQGLPLIVTLKPSLVALFGSLQYARACADILNGKDSQVIASAQLVADLEAETQRERLLQPPLPRPYGRPSPG